SSSPTRSASANSRRDRRGGAGRSRPPVGRRLQSRDGGQLPWSGCVTRARLESRPQTPTNNEPRSMSVKSTVEQLSPTRVRINVEVPFEELKPDFDRAYKALAKQVRIPGFRPGKAPAKLLEARLGRGAILEQVVNDVLPG